jgi:hypothetical protein
MLVYDLPHDRVNALLGQSRMDGLFLERPDLRGPVAPLSARVIEALATDRH